MNAEWRIHGSNVERFHRMRKGWQVCVDRSELVQVRIALLLTAGNSVQIVDDSNPGGVKAVSVFVSQL